MFSSGHQNPYHPQSIPQHFLSQDSHSEKRDLSDHETTNNWLKNYTSFWYLKPPTFAVHAFSFYFIFLCSIPTSHQWSFLPRISKIPLSLLANNLCATLDTFQFPGLVHLILDCPEEMTLDSLPETTTG